MMSSNTCSLRYVIEMFGREVVPAPVRVGLELILEERNLAKNCDCKGFLETG